MTVAGSHHGHSHPHSSSSASAANGTGRSKYSMFGPWRLLRTLGEGEFGKVKLAVHTETSKEVAIKLIKKENIETPTRRSKLMREISVLQSLDHAYIVKLIEVIETDHYIGMVMEYASGGELFEHIFAHRYLKENDARRFFAQLISGVAYIHKQGVVHRDLKLENLLLDGENNVIISDFGFANLTREDALLQTSCGSPCYAAPELVISDGYVGEAADIWSCGVILYAMLCGYLPFDDDPANPDSDNINLLYKYILETELDFPDFVTDDARQLLQKMLVPDPKYRVKMAEIMSHRWLAPVSYIFEAERIRKEEPAPSSAPVAVHPTPPVTPTHVPPAVSAILTPEAETEEPAAVVPEVIDAMDVDVEPVVTVEVHEATPESSPPAKPQSILTSSPAEVPLPESDSTPTTAIAPPSPAFQTVPTSPQEVATLSDSTAIATADTDTGKTLEQALLDIVSFGESDSNLKDISVPSTPPPTSGSLSRVPVASPTTPKQESAKPPAEIPLPESVPTSPARNASSSAGSSHGKRSASSRASQRSLVDEDSNSSGNLDGKRTSTQSVNPVMTWFRKKSTSEEMDKTSIAPRASSSAQSSNDLGRSRSQRTDRETEAWAALPPPPRMAKTPTRTDRRPVSGFDRTVSTSSELTKGSVDASRPSMSASIMEANQFTVNSSTYSLTSFSSKSSTSRIVFHSGPVDQRALTPRDPVQLIPEIVNILVERGMQVRSTRPDEFKIKVVRLSSGDPLAMQSKMDMAELERHFNRGISIDGVPVSEDGASSIARQSIDSTRPTIVNGKPVPKSFKESLKEKKRRARGASRLAFIIASLPVSLVKRVKYLAQHGPNWAHGFDGRTSIDEIEAREEDADGDAVSVKSGKSGRSHRSNRSGRSRRSMSARSKRASTPGRRPTTPTGGNGTAVPPLPQPKAQPQRFEPEIRFNIEIQRIRNLPGLYVVDFKRVRGDIWAFKRLYHSVIDSLPLKEASQPTISVAGSSNGEVESLYISSPTSPSLSAVVV